MKKIWPISIQMLTVALSSMANDSSGLGNAVDLAVARMPYRAACQMAHFDLQKTIGFTNQSVTLSVRSANPSVKISDISIYIDAKSGRIPININTNGVMTLPITDDLIKENPSLVANQPKGSMIIEALYEAKGTMLAPELMNDGGRIRYSALFALEKADAAMRQNMSEIKGAQFTEKRQVIVLIQAKKNIDKAEVTIQARDGDLKLKPIAPGRFMLRFDDKLMQENPWIYFKEGHGWAADAGFEGAGIPAVRPQP